MKNRLDFIETVADLNTMIFENDKDNYEPAFIYSTDGFIDIIAFQDKILWSSEDEDRKWIEEIQDYEPIKPFLLNKLNLHIDKMASIFKENS